MHYDSVLLTVITIGSLIEITKSALHVVSFVKRKRVVYRRRKTTQSRNLKKKLIKLVANE